jgi:hypothetical protein
LNFLPTKLSGWSDLGSYSLQGGVNPEGCAGSGLC